MMKAFLTLFLLFPFLAIADRYPAKELGDLFPKGPFTGQTPQGKLCTAWVEFFEKPETYVFHMIYGTYDYYYNWDGKNPFTSFNQYGGDLVERRVTPEETYVELKVWDGWGSPTSERNMRRESIRVIKNSGVTVVKVTGFVLPAGRLKSITCTFDF